MSSYQSRVLRGRDGSKVLHMQVHCLVDHDGGAQDKAKDTDLGKAWR